MGRAADLSRGVTTIQDSPSPPDPYALANTQTKSNIATATANQNLNMVDQSNPYGSLKYSQTGTNPDGTPKYSADTTLSAPMQGIFDKSTGVANNLLSSGAGGLSGKGLDLSYNGTTAALDALNKKRLDPQWAQNTDTQESKLAAQGLTPGMPGYDNAMRVFNQGKNDAYNSANLADYGLSSQNAATEYNAPVNTLGSLLGVAKGVAPTFAQTPTTNVAGTNVSGLVEQNYGQQSQNANAANGQIAGLLGTALGAGANVATGGMSGTMGGLFGSTGGLNAQGVAQNKQMFPGYGTG